MRLSTRPTRCWSNVDVMLSTNKIITLMSARFAESVQKVAEPGLEEIVEV
jgi:hypothetical protein